MDKENEILKPRFLLYKTQGLDTKVIYYCCALCNDQDKIKNRGDHVVETKDLGELETLIAALQEKIYETEINKRHMPYIPLFPGVPKNDGMFGSYHVSPMDAQYCRAISKKIREY
jgi:hypothetical protein